MHVKYRKKSPYRAIHMLEHPSHLENHKQVVKENKEGKQGYG